MATIKSYTDLEQSKKLADILPLESADMGYLWNGTSFCEWPVSNQTIFNRIENIPCWSLAALLNVLPEGTILLKSSNISSVGDVKYHIECPKLNIDKWFDNPVDACVDMILKLHELNLL